MRALLSAHPSIAIASETHFLNRFAADIDDSDLATTEQFRTFWDRFARSDRFVDLGIDADTVRDRILDSADFRLRNVFATTLQEYARVAGKSRWGEKTPAHDRFVGTLLGWFPDARVIYMLRDPRAACVSLLGAPWRTNAASSEGHTPLDPARRLQLLEEDSNHWRESVERHQRVWQGDSRVTLVRYEDLAARPEQTMRDVCRFVGAPFDSRILERRSEDALPPVRAQLQDKEHQAWRSAHIERAREAVSADSLTRWRSLLSSAEIEVIESNCRKQMAEFGYGLESEDA
jgi:hypothetical protein